MRKTVVATIVLVLLWLAYVLWPIYSLVRLTQALERGDMAAALHYIDFGAVRASLTEQIVEGYLRTTRRQISPLARGVARSATSIAEPVIGRIVSPEAFADFLKTGWPKSVIPERPRDATGLTRENLGTAFRIFASADYGIRRFDVSIPAGASPDRQFEFGFRLSQWRWQLAHIGLPESIRVLLAEALANALKAQR